MLFDFDLLDDVLSDTSGDCIKEMTRCLLSASAYHLGAIVEYGYLQSQLENQQWPHLGAARAKFADAFLRASGEHSFEAFLDRTSLDPRSIEFARPPTNVEEAKHLGWVAFRKRLQAAAAVVVGRSTANRLTGSFDEVQQNAIDHSQNPSSALVGYAFDSDVFMLFVVDGGEGVLTSLRRNPAHRSLRDSAEALETAMHSGVSRYTDQLRGNGFRQVLSNLEFEGCNMRFRSGDALLKICRDRPRMIAIAPEFQGFYWHLEISA